MLVKDYRVGRGDLLTIVSGVASIGADPVTGSRSIATFAVVEATPEQIDVYDVLIRTLYECLAAIRPGVALGQMENMARRSLVGSGYGEYGFWANGESLFWSYDGRWKRVPGGAEFFLMESCVLNIEPSVKIPSLKAYTMTKSGDEFWVESDLVKVGVTIAVTSDGCEIIGGGPPKSLRIIDVST